MGERLVIVNQISELDDFYNQLPNEWYDAQENNYYSQTG